MLSYMCLILAGLFVVTLVANLIVLFVVANKAPFLIQAPILLLLALAFFGGWRALGRLAEKRLEDSASPSKETDAAPE